MASLSPTLQRPTLVLNRNWQPINVATVARALILLWNDRWTLRRGVLVVNADLGHLAIADALRQLLGGGHHDGFAPLLGYPVGHEDGFDGGQHCLAATAAATRWFIGVAGGLDLQALALGPNSGVSTGKP